MRSLYYLLPTLLTISISFLIIRAAAIALMMTGLDIKKAKFQALSTFSGTDFTTKETEAVVNHPVRRKIITGLIILGNVGIVTVIVTTTSSLVASRIYELPINFVFLLAGTIGLYLVANRRGYIRRFENYEGNGPSVFTLNPSPLKTPLNLLKKLHHISLVPNGELLL